MAILQVTEENVFQDISSWNRLHYHSRYNADITSSIGGEFKMKVMESVWANGFGS